MDSRVKAWGLNSLSVKEKGARIRESTREEGGEDLDSQVL